MTSMGILENKVVISAAGEAYITSNKIVGFSDMVRKLTKFSKIFPGLVEKEVTIVAYL